MQRRIASVLALLLVAGAAAAARLPILQAGAPPPRVEVWLYGEALCPDCAHFVTNVLEPLLAGGFQDIISFAYIAWGNSKITPRGLQCQHGPAECRLDRVINCSQQQKGPWLPFLVCLEDTRPVKMEVSVGSCAYQAGLDASELRACAEGTQGDELERAAQEETANLKPIHTYVPWVLVNGVALGSGDLRTTVCAAYRGSRPPACFDPPHRLQLTAGERLLGWLRLRLTT